MMREMKYGMSTYISVPAWVKLNWLRHEFQNVPQGLSQVELYSYIRALILFSIGTNVVLDGSTTFVSVMYLPLLEDIEGIKNYAWGAALAAHLNASLKIWKEKSFESFMGDSLSLQVSIRLSRIKV